MAPYVIENRSGAFLGQREALIATGTYPELEQHYNPQQFEPPKESHVKTLSALCAKVVAKTMNRETIEEKLVNDPRYGGIPPLLERYLDHAEDNVQKFDAPLFTCRCGQQYVLPRAEWIEIWGNAEGDILPFKTSVCSWRCAERMHLKSYLDLESPPELSM